MDNSFVTPEERIKEIDKEIIKTTIIDAPGTILVGLGLYAKFGVTGESFHQILANESVVMSMLALGGAIMAWSAFKIMRLSKEKKELQIT